MCNFHYIPVKVILEQADVLVSHSYLAEVTSNRLPFMLLIPTYFVLWWHINSILGSTNLIFVTTISYINCCRSVNKQLRIDSLLDWEGHHRVYISLSSDRSIADAIIWIFFSISLSLPSFFIFTHTPWQTFLHILRQCHELCIN